MLRGNRGLILVLGLLEKTIKILHSQTKFRPILFEIARDHVMKQYLRFFCEIVLLFECRRNIKHVRSEKKTRESPAFSLYRSKIPMTRKMRPSAKTT